MSTFIGPGEVLGDRYVVRRIEWTTPLGPVWSARDRVLDRPVLVQVLAGPAAEHAGARRAFQKAAGRTAQVTHPNVLQVFDIGDQPGFVVFEHGAGGRLADRLRTGPMRTLDAARITLSLARALEALHERQTWHGSLAPNTVLFDEEGRAKLMPIGQEETCRAAGLADPTAEQPSTYRPPEPVTLPADADRYALAALAFHMFTGRVPPGPGASPRALRRSVPDEIDRLLRDGLSPNPAERPTIDEFIAALAPFTRVMPRDARQPRMEASELRWLVPVIAIVVAAALAVTLGGRLIQALTEDTPGAGASPSPTAADTVLDIADVVDFDPEGGGRFPGEENRPLVPRAVDGDPRTSWRTVDYRQANVGGKQGVGLLFDLGSVQRIRSLRIQSTLPGWQAEIRAADERGDRHSDYAEITEFTAETESTVQLPNNTRARYVLLWIVRLVDSEGGDEGGAEFPFRAEVSEVELLG